MPHRLKWSRPALQDLLRLYRFLAAKSPEAAQRAVAAIRNGVNVLGQHPEIGRLIDDLPAEFREWIIDFGASAYVVLYHFDGSEIVLLAVRHGREAGY